MSSKVWMAMSMWRITSFVDPERFPHKHTTNEPREEESNYVRLIIIPSDRFGELSKTCFCCFDL